MKRIGIDVGGTHTDAVLVDGTSIVASVKSQTTSDVTSGIVDVVHRLLATQTSQADIEAVMIGTTHFTNAVVERRQLTPVAAIRLGLPSTTAVPPMYDWPKSLRKIVDGGIYLCHGGHEFDGREISKLDADEIHRIIEQLAVRDTNSIAITSVFSPINPACEEQVAAIIAAELPHCYITLSHKIGHLGLLERENAAILNASLRPMADTITASLTQALSIAGIKAPLFLSQNDGTLMDVDSARAYPVATFASGPTNSMRGAAFLSELDNCIVIDVGGTTTDVGALCGGFPRMAPRETFIGGVRTNFRMPDILSIGLGGGSWVTTDENCPVGPQSVGYKLTSKAMIFGGDVLTATDIAVAAGLADIGDATLVATLDRALVRSVIRRITERTAQAADRMLTSQSTMPLVLVGGGSVLLPESIPGFPEIHRPKHFSVANAIGTAIAQVGGAVDIICYGTGIDRATVLAEAEHEATDKAIAAGADPSTTKIVEIDEIPLAYLSADASRIKVKVVGDLKLT